MPATVTASDFAPVLVHATHVEPRSAAGIFDVRRDNRSILEHLDINTADAHAVVEPDGRAKRPAGIAGAGQERTRLIVFRVNHATATRSPRALTAGPFTGQAGMRHPSS